MHYGKIFFFLCAEEQKFLQAENVPPAPITFPIVRPLWGGRNKVWQGVPNKDVFLKGTSTPIKESL